MFFPVPPRPDPTRRSGRDGLGRAGFACAVVAGVAEGTLFLADLGQVPRAVKVGGVSLVATAALLAGRGCRWVGRCSRVAGQGGAARRGGLPPAAGRGILSGLGRRQRLAGLTAPVTAPGGGADAEPGAAVDGRPKAAARH